MHTNRQELRTRSTTHPIFMILVISLCGPLAALAAPAHAQTFNSWNLVASGCVPDAQSVSDGVVRYDVAHGAVSFAPSGSGHIYLTCPIHAVFFPGLSPLFGLSYYNDHGFDGGNDHCTIKASLLRGELAHAIAFRLLPSAGSKSGEATTLVW